MFRQLDPHKIHKTILRLEARIGERFPESGLCQVAGELAAISSETIERTRSISRPYPVLRVIVMVLMGLIVGGVGIAIFMHEPPEKSADRAEFIGILEPSLGACFFLGAIVLFLWSFEQRIKRQRALDAIHELRSMAHVIDMHQLTKDPAHIIHQGPQTKSSPQRGMTSFKLGRYYDYCSEMLSLISKIAALYVQGLPDSQAISAVDEIEGLTTGLSRKIWQKITLLEHERAH